MNTLSTHGLLNRLAGSWETGIPDIEESGPKPELKRLQEISAVVKEALESKQECEAAAQVANRCWEFATRAADPHLALLACEICDENLSKANSQVLKLLIGEEEIVLKSYYKALLANMSPYFKALFEGKAESFKVEGL